MSQADDPVTIRVNGHKLLTRALIALFVIELSFVFFDATLNYDRWIDSRSMRRFFNMTREDGLGSWFAVTQTAFVSATLVWTAVIEKIKGVPKQRLLGWIILAAFFGYMAFDDGTMFHERLGSTFKSTDDPDSWFPSYGWQMLFLPFFGTIGLYMVYFIFRELPYTWARVGVVVAVGMLVVAVGMDFFEGMQEDATGNIYAGLGSIKGFDELSESRWNESAYDAIVHFSKSVEECLEMMANSVLWWVFARNLLTTAPKQLLIVEGLED